MKPRRRRVLLDDFHWYALGATVDDQGHEFQVFLALVRDAVAHACRRTSNRRV